MKLQKAVKFATNAHRKQKRKYTDEPYINHCFNVFDIVKKLSLCNTDTLIAALLHDTVEDTETNLNDIKEIFGAHVAYLVDGLTDVSRPEDGNRAARKKLDRDHLAGGCSAIHTIKLADLIDNTLTIVEHDPEFAKIYMDEKRELLKVLTRGDSYLYGEAYKIVNQYYKGE